MVAIRDHLGALAARRVFRPRLVLSVAVISLVALGAVAWLALAVISPRWTGIAISVPPCSADMGGCRVFVIPAADAYAEPAAHSPVVAVAGWSGLATTIDIHLPPGSYGVSAKDAWAARSTARWSP